MRLVRFLQESMEPAVIQNDVCVGIVVGKFNPFHVGHLALIREACSKNSTVYACMVIAENSTRHELQFEISSLLTTILPVNCKLKLVTNGYIPKVFSKSELGEKIVTIYCGPDRQKTYEAMAEEVKRKFSCCSVDVQVEDFQRDFVSSTKIREMLKNNDPEVQKLLPYPVDKISRWF